jgi:IclR family acetate operon transcriptional repressor
MQQKSRIQFLDRAMDILEVLSRHKGAGVTELAAEVELHVATRHNILTVLLARNYVLNDHRTYRVGPALAALASQSDPVVNLLRVSQPRLEEITRRTRESAVAGVLSGNRLIMVATTAGADGLTCLAVNQAFVSPLRLAGAGCSLPISRQGTGHGTFDFT